jgi:O-antigen ligase
MDRTLASRRRATGAIYALLALPAVFWLMNRLPYLQISAVLLGLGLFAALTMRRLRVNAGSARAAVLVIAIGGYFLFSYLLSGQSLTEFFSYGFLRRDGNFFFAYTPFLIFSIAAGDPKGQARMLFRFALITASAFGILGIIEYASGHNVLFIRQEPHGARLFMALNEAHNAAGSLYAIAFLLGMSTFLFGEHRHRQLMALLVAILFVSLVLTKSRGALLAALAAGTYLVYLRYRRQGFVRRMIALSTVAVPLFLAGGGLERMLTVTDLDHVTNAVRIQHIMTASEITALSPLIGIGFGRYNDYNASSGHLTYAGVSGVAYVATAGKAVHSDSHAHNSYLHFLAETGVVGLGLVLALWIHCFLRIRRKFNRCRNQPGFERTLFAATLAAIVCLAFLSLTEHHMATPTTIIVLAALTTTALNVQVPASGEPKAVNGDK